jgi:glycosyltransferase involved in cell wall biosynthesis
VVGPASEREAARLADLAAALGVAGRVELTNEVDETAYERWLRRATVAVQLRASANGESSAAVGDCLAAGLPTVVTRLGAARELPDDATVKVDRDVPPAALAAVVASLLADPGRRATMSAAAVRHAGSHGFEVLAAALLRVLGTST